MSDVLAIMYPSLYIVFPTVDGGCYPRYIVVPCVDRGCLPHYIVVSCVDGEWGVFSLIDCGLSVCSRQYIVVLLQHCVKCTLCFVAASSRVL